MPLSFIFPPTSRTSSPLLLNHELLMSKSNPTLFQDLCLSSLTNILLYLHELRWLNMWTFLSFKSTYEMVLNFLFYILTYFKKQIFFPFFFFFSFLFTYFDWPWNQPFVGNKGNLFRDTSVIPHWSHRVSGQGLTGDGEPPTHWNWVENHYWRFHVKFFVSERYISSRCLKVTIP